MFIFIIFKLKTLVKFITHRNCIIYEYIIVVYTIKQNTIIIYNTNINLSYNLYIFL